LNLQPCQSYPPFGGGFVSGASENQYRRDGAKSRQYRYETQRRENVESDGLFVMVNRPTEILAQGFLYRIADFGLVDRYMVFKAVITDIGQQILHTRNLHNAIAAECS